MLPYTVRYEPKAQRTPKTATIAIIILLIALAWPNATSSIAIGNHGSFVTAKGMYIPVTTLVLPNMSYQETCTKHKAVYLGHSLECYIPW